MGDHVDLCEEPEKIPDVLAARKQAAESGSTEAKAYLQMFHAIPIPQEAGNGLFFLDTNDLMSLGTNLLHDLGRQAVSQIVKPLTARVVPVGGTRETLNSCVQLGQMIDGIHEYSGFHGMCELVVQQSICVPSGGHILWEVDPIKKDIVPEPLHPLHTFPNYDRTDVLFQHFMSRRKALARWGKTDELREVIKTQPNARPEQVVGAESDGQWNATDLIAPIEYYITPLGDEKGKHFVYFDREHIIEAPYDLPVIPIATMVWEAGLLGRHFGGTPMARMIAGGASWQKQLYHRMWESAQACVPWIKNSPDNWRPSDVPHQKVPEGVDGKAIEIEFPPAFAKELIELADNIDTRAAKATGVIEGENGTSAPPSSLTSGVAISSWVSVRNEALAPQHRQFDDLYTQSGRIICAYGPTVYKTRKAVVSARGTEVIEQISWGELSLPEKDGIQLSFDVVSGMGSHVPQKIQMLELALEKGAIDVGQYFAMLDFPDFRAAAKRLGGPRAFIEFQIDQALSHGNYIAPSLMQDQAQLETLMKSAGEAYLAEMASKRPAKQENLNKLRLLWRVARQYVKSGAPAPAPLPSPGAALMSAPDPALLPPTTAGLAPDPAQPLPIDNVGLPASDAALAPIEPVSPGLAPPPTVAMSPV